MAYVEVKAKTVEMAIEAAMRELGVSDRERLEVEVMQEPERGFLGFGGQDAIVKVAEKQGKPKRSRGKKRSRSRSGNKDGGREKGQNGRSGRPSDGEGSQKAGASAKEGQGRPQKAPRSEKAPGRKDSPRSEKGPARDDDRGALDIGAQEPLVRDFLQGLLGTLGLEGEVETKIEDEVIVANVVGEQTEALVGQRGSVMEAVHELTKTVLQRAAQEPARVRIDIAGYAERRRQALTIYAGELIEQVLSEGGELMLEPMSASDRKVIHDAVAEREGVRSYSEGEAPGRYVVIAADEAPASPDEAPAPAEDADADGGDESDSSSEE